MMGSANKYDGPSFLPRRDKRRGANHLRRKETVCFKTQRTRTQNVINEDISPLRFTLMDSESGRAVACIDPKLAGAAPNGAP
jgi:hypothetical protein